MSVAGVLMQIAGAALLFAAIEGMESALRRWRPGRHPLWYAAGKIAVGVPLVTGTWLALRAADVAILYPAVALGLALAAVATLLLFGQTSGGDT